MKYILILVISLVTNVVFAQQVVDLKRHVDYLTSADLQGRKAGSPACDKAADYLIQQLKASGYSPEEQIFPLPRGQSKNIIAVRKGAVDSVLVVGAHYDAVGPLRRSFCPGADDNASGTASVLELAKMVKTSRRNIVFIFFSGEEEGLYGSAYYVKHPLYPNEKTIFMVNLDMVGYLRTDTQAYVPDVQKILRDLYIQYPWAPSLVILGGKDSDQESFAEVGIPVAFLHTGLHANYHKISDTPDKLNYEGLEQITYFTHALIQALDTHDLPDYNILGDTNGRE